MVKRLTFVTLIVSPETGTLVDVILICENAELNPKAKHAESINFLIVKNLHKCNNFQLISVKIIRDYYVN
jgi:hypothetical protein